MSKISQEHKIMLIFILGFLLIITPLALRALQNNTPLYGPSSAYYARLVNQGTADDQIQKRSLPFNLFTYTLSRTGLNTEPFISIIPFILGLISLIFYYLIIKKQEKPFLTLLILVSSPAFLFLFSTFTPFIIIIFLNLLGFFLFLQKKGWISFIVLSIIPLIDFFSYIITILLLLIYSLYNKNKLQAFYIVLVISLAPAIFMLVTNTINLLYPFDFLGLENTLFEFGAINGITIPLLLLGFIGIPNIWKKPGLRLANYAFFIILLVLSTFSSSIRIYFALALPFFAGKAILYFINHKWSITSLKNITFLLIFCSFLFPAVSFLHEVVAQPPNKEMITTLHYLQQISPDNATIISSENNGFFIEAYAQRRAFLDQDSYQYPKYEEKKTDLQTILYSRKLENTTQLLDKYGINYIYIDSDMKQTIWNNKEEGLLFLLQNSHDFIKQYSTQTSEIWQYGK